MFGINIGALIIIVIAVLAPAIGWWQSAQRLDVCKADFQSFKDNTQLEGERSEHDRAAKETALASAAVNIQGELNEARIDRDKRYADFQRLLTASKAANTSSGEASGTTTSAPGLSCPDAGAEFNSRMAGFEVEVAQSLLKSRDEAIERTIACKHYIEQITNITNTEDKNATIQRK